MEDCIEANTVNQTEAINDISLGYESRTSILGRKDLVMEGFANIVPATQAKYFSINIGSPITPNWNRDQIFIELPLSTDYEIFIHDPTFFTMNYMIPMALPAIYLRAMANQTNHYYHTIVVTEVKELDLADDQCNADKTYNFQV